MRNLLSSSLDPSTSFEQIQDLLPRARLKPDVVMVGVGASTLVPGTRGTWSLMGFSELAGLQLTSDRLPQFSKAQS